jgi:hypothetical protein
MGRLSTLTRLGLLLCASCVRDCAVATYAVQGGMFQCEWQQVSCSVT